MGISTKQTHGISKIWSGAHSKAACVAMLLALSSVNGSAHQQFEIPEFLKSQMKAVVNALKQPEIEALVLNFAKKARIDNDQALLGFSRSETITPPAWVQENLALALKQNSQRLYEEFPELKDKPLAHSLWYIILNVKSTKTTRLGDIILEALDQHIGSLSQLSKDYQASFVDLLRDKPLDLSNLDLRKMWEPAKGTAEAEDNKGVLEDLREYWKKAPSSGSADGG